MRIDGLTRRTLWLLGHHRQPESCRLGGELEAGDGLGEGVAKVILVGDGSLGLLLFRQLLDKTWGT